MGRRYRRTPESIATEELKWSIAVAFMALFTSALLDAPRELFLSQEELVILTVNSLIGAGIQTFFLGLLIAVAFAIGLWFQNKSYTTMEHTTRHCIAIGFVILWFIIGVSKVYVL